MIDELRMAFRHFREIAMHSLAGVNILVGPNNSGKTSIFRGIQRMAPQPPLDDSEQLCIGTYIPLPSEVKYVFSDALGSSQVFDGDIDKLVQWWRTDSQNRQVNYVGTGDDDRNHRLSPSSGEKIGFYLQDPSRGGGLRRIPRQSVLQETEALMDQQESWRQHLYFLWHRRKSRYEEELGAFHGRLDDEAEHLAGRLDHLLTDTRGGAVRSKINRFMNAVIPGIGDIGIRRREAEAGGKKTLISVIFSNPREDRTLDELGGGVEQVLALAVVLIGEKDEGAIFIEEPESHLHESAQRRLIEQIVKHRGERQIFIATHSPVFVNEFPDANVYRVTRDPEGQATVHSCVDRASQREILNELGVLPSSLTQTNCVLWVEGPTETRLVRHWLSLVAPELRVHQHYEFAETGGSNLGSLAADLPADDAEHLRDIMRVCRHNFMICDRDAGIDDPPSKQPVKTIEDLVGVNHWITRGYEIEWYIPPDIIAAVWGQAASIHMVACTAANEPFYKRLADSGVRGTKSAGEHKVLWAERVINQEGFDEAWFKGPMGEHLRANIERVAEFIRRANQMIAPAGSTCGECGQPSPSR